MSEDTETMIEARYENALNWIHSTMRFGSKLGLERISRLLEVLGSPHTNMKFVHVAGTNGKGSVTAMVASVLQQSGYRTGMYISPYLEDYRERIMINGKKIPKAKVSDLVEKIKAATEDLVEEGFDHPTEFEINTAMALMYFAEENCDYVSFEVGLGGRFDATNVVTPVVSVITTIGYDHMEQLGSTLSQISFEKAGIIKPGVPVVTGVCEEEPLAVIKKRASDLGSPLTIVGKVPFADVTWEEIPCEKRPSDAVPIPKGATINVEGPGYSFENVHVPLLGKHQELNAALAIAALKQSRVKPLRLSVLDDQKVGSAQTVGGENLEMLPIALDDQGVGTGIERTVWPGRLEIMHNEPLVILDGAHNPQGAQVLSEFLGELRERRIICVYGILGDKSYKEATSSIVPLCDEVIVTKPQTPRALDPLVLADEVRRYTEKVWIEENLDRALELALDRASSNDVVMCCGSLYLVGPARTFLRRKFNIPAYGGN